MKPFRLTDADKRKLAGVDPRLVAVIERLAKVTPKPFMVVEGRRSLARQRELVRKGASKTLNSKHLTGRAVDIAPLVNGKLSWEWRDFKPVIEAAKAVAADMGVPMNFGYDWGWDAPHLELR